MHTMYTKNQDQSERDWYQNKKMGAILVEKNQVLAKFVARGVTPKFLLHYGSSLACSWHKNTSILCEILS